MKEKIIALSFLIGQVIIFIITSSVKNHPNNSSYIVQELFRQSSTIYVGVQIIAMLYMSGYNLGPRNISVPLIAATISYTNSIFMGYAITSDCNKPKRTSIFSNSLIIPIAVTAFYFLTLNISFMRQGFYDIFNSGDSSNISNWVAISFWMSMIIFPSMSITYFKLEKKACNNNDVIEIRKVKKSDELKLDETII